MKRFSMFLCCVTLALGLTTVANALPTEFITNGGFETGDLTGWDQTPNAVAVENSWWDVSPHEGQWMAVMAPLGQLDAYLLQDTPGFDPAVYPEVTLSFAYNLKALDWNGPDNNNDYFAALANGFPLFELYFNDVFDGGRLNPGTPTELGWQVFSETYPIAAVTGPITFAFFVDNIPPGGELAQSMVAYIDDVSVSAAPVPEPATMLLLGAGLVCFGVAGRKKLFKKS